MSRNQLILDSMFRNTHYGPRGGFEPRDWQIDCLDAYRTSVDLHRLTHESNGSGEQHRFCLYAGTGSGKTKAAACLMSYLLNGKKIDQIVFVCPNRSIRSKAQRDLLKHFGIDLARFHAKKHADGIPRIKQGYILTYSHLMQDPTLHRRICMASPTAVIFDEIHHLGDANGWGDSAKEAFGLVPYVLTLSGTPYRSDDTMIPFVHYEAASDEGVRRFKPDFTYSLGQAIVDGVCRKPLFVFHDGQVMIRSDSEPDERTIGFDEKVSDSAASLRLRGAVLFGSATRKKMLSQALRRCRDENRKVIVFLGGDTDGDQTPREDAWNLLPSELDDLGIGPEEFDVVTGDDPEAQKKIDAFGVSSKWILISINMVSEGTDIPELSAAIFLTSITAKQTTVQRIGRILRRLGESDPHKDSLVFMFGDWNLKALADEIESEIKQEIDLRRARRDPSSGEGSTEPRRRAEAIGVSGGEMKTVKFNGQEWPIDVIEKARNEVRERGLPVTMLTAVLSLMVEAPTHVNS